LDLTEGTHVDREMMLIKLRASGPWREETKRIADIFRGRILDVTNTTYIVELTGTADKLNAFIEALDKKSILEVVRSGSLGVGRGEKSLRL
jgi:acetolactate synthase-1/3 small subunit